jgi:hypothetical protein
VLQDLLGADLELCLGPNRQREQVEQGIEIGLLGKLLQTEPNHAIDKRLQMLRQPVNTGCCITPDAA